MLMERIRRRGAIHGHGVLIPFVLSLLVFIATQRWFVGDIALTGLKMARSR